MNVLKKTYIKAGQHPIKSGVIITILAALVLFTLNRVNQPVLELKETPSMPEVTLSTAQAFADSDSLSLLGKVRAASEAAVTSERAGRVVRVNVTLGQTVGAGQVLATLENAAENAAVVQAEGRYDAAVAAKAQAQAADRQSSVGVNESQNTLAGAQNAAINAYKSAYTTVSGVIYNNVDTFFTNPNTTLPGLRISGLGQTSYLNSERADYRLLLTNWQEKADSLTNSSDIPAALNEAETNLKRTVAIVDTFISLLNRQNTNYGRYSDAELQAFSTTFTSLRSSLTASQNAIEAARTGLKTAQDVGERADINTSVSGVPAADAQIKQALGALQAAQANYAKTVLRTPIGGTINSLDIKQGDFINSFVKVAQVANNNALEIVAYISDKERDVVAVGDVVFIENQYEGRIAQIAPAIDSATGKTEVRIVTENTKIKNGQTVNVSKEVSATTSENSAVIIPLTAVKFEIKDGFVFTVADGKLVQNPVELGTIRGDSVQISSGLSATDQFVVDARGLLAGTAVTVRK